MGIKIKDDVRTLLWAFVFFPSVALSHYVFPSLVGYLLPLSLYMGFCSGVFSHNHNHCATFKSRGMNTFYSAWLSFFYGYPTFAWIPTHNQGHHTYVNKPGDYTITWRYSKKHTWLIASTYFFVSAYWQSAPITQFIANARRNSPKLFQRILLQYATVLGGHLSMFVLAVVLHGLKTGALVYTFGFGIPSAFALWSMMFINYIQHVDCDPWSPRNHSRNFCSKVGNWLVFNNGFHTVHHDHPTAHWTTLPALHAAIEKEIDPALNQSSIFGFCLRTYVLGLFSKRFRTHQVGRPAFEPPAGYRPASESNADDTELALA